MQTFVPRLRAFVLGAATLAAIAASAGSASAATKPYSVSITPATVAAGTHTTFSAKVSNPAGAQQQVGTVKLTAPAGISLVAGTASLSGAGTVKLTGSVVELDDIAVQPGSSVTLSIEGDVACSPTGARTWGVQAKQANNFNGPPGNDLTLVGPVPTTTVTGQCSLRFVAQPANARVDAAITSTAYSPAGAPVAVEVVDGANARVTSSNASITLAKGAGPVATLKGTTTVAASQGVASFPGINLGVPGTYDLTATSTGLTGATSSAFKVDTTVTQCVEDATCTGSASTTKTNVSVTSFGSNTLLDAGFLTISLNAGPIIDCAGYTEISPDIALVDVSSANRTKTATLTFDKKLMQVFPNNGASFLEVCFGSPSSFSTQSGVPAVLQGTFDWNADGIQEPVYVGLLPNCPAAPPCAFGRKKTGAGDGVISADLPIGDPAMRG